MFHEKSSQLVEAEVTEKEGLQISQNVREIRNIRSYQYDSQGLLQPVYGDRIGLWHSVSGVFISVEDQDFWEVYDFIIEDAKEPGKYRKGIELLYLLQHFDHVDDFALGRTIGMLELLGFVKKNNHEPITHIKDNLTRAEVYIHLTEDCNFSCTGCCTKSDVLRGPTAKTIDIDLLRSGIKHIVRSSVEKGFTELTLKWAGGEPSLPKAFSLIEQAQPLIRELELRWGISLSQTILSNGVPLTQKKIDFLKKHNIHTVISFWGLENDNETLRSPHTHAKTFAKVRENIRRCVQTGLDFNVLTVIKPENAHVFAEVLNALYDPDNPDYFLKDLGSHAPIALAVNFYRPQQSEELGRVLAEKKLVLNGIRMGFDVILELVHRGIAVSLPDVWDYLNLTRTTDRTCGIGKSYGSFGINGIASCHEDTSDPRFQSLLPKLFEGENFWDLSTSSFEPDDLELLKTSSGRILFQNQAQIDLAFHGGKGCPRSRKDQSGRLTPVIPELYSVYTDIYRELLTVLLVTRVKQSPVRALNAFKHNACSECPRDGSCNLHRQVAIISAVSQQPDSTLIVSQLVQLVTQHPELLLVGGFSGFRKTIPTYLYYRGDDLKKFEAELEEDLTRLIHLSLVCGSQTEDNDTSITFWHNQQGIMAKLV